MAKTIVENKIHINVQDFHDNPSKSSTFYNEKMKINREFALLALMTLRNQVGLEEKPTKCLDAFAASGIAGFQWKAYLKDQIELTSNELDPVSLQNIKDNAELNQFGYNKEDISGPNNIEITNKDCNILMHERQFHFIHLDPFGCTVQFLEAAFRNIYNNGIMVVTSTDIAALLGKCDDVTLRNYGAVTIRCDYRKEIAVRILLASLTRAAAHCRKGIKVLYSVYLEHFVQVAVQIQRGAQKANDSVRHISTSMVCQYCEQHAYIPPTLAPLSKPYDLLKCKCQEEYGGSKNAVIIGPLYTGLVHDLDFVSRALKIAKENKLSTRIVKNLENIVDECNCYVKKECISDAGDGPSEKKAKLDQRTRSISSPHKYCPEIMFFFNLHQRKLRYVNVPTIHKLSTMLKSKGYFASGTNFDPQAIKTNATLEEIKVILKIKKDN